jgi:hypothetical protein
MSGSAGRGVTAPLTLTGLRLAQWPELVCAENAHEYYAVKDTIRFCFLGSKEARLEDKYCAANIIAHGPIGSSCDPLVKVNAEGLRLLFLSRDV